MVDFFASQERAKQASGSLVFYFVLGFIGVIALVVLLTMLLILPLQPFFMPPPGKWAFYEFRWLLLGVGLGTAAYMLLASLWKMHTLRQGGGEAVAAMLGGRLLRPDTTAPLERRLCNVVEEIAIASQTPTPLIFVLDKECGINAFAAGFTPHQAVLGITRGATELLPRDALQALVAHEFSHICNGDMRLNLRLMGLLHGILFLALTGYGLTRASLGNTGDSEGAFIPGILAGLALGAIGSAGTFSCTLLKAAVGRQREFLADAAAVEFTRNPAALIQVLLTIGGCRQGSLMDSPHAPLASHLYFANGLNTWLARKLATHPTLEERIRRIDPFYQGPWPHKSAVEETTLRQSVLAQARIELAGFAGAPINVRKMPVAIHDEKLPGAYRRHALALLGKLPHSIQSAARSGRDAPSLLCAMLLARSRPDELDLMSDVLLEYSDVTFHDKALRQAEILASVPCAAFLPLLHLILPHLPFAGREEILRRVKALIAADKRVNLFEWMLEKVLANTLQDPESTPQRDVLPTWEEKALACAMLLAALARSGMRGTRDAPSAQQAAFNAGAGVLGISDLKMPRTQRVRLRDVDASLEVLGRLAAQARQGCMAACLACVRHTGEVTQEQAELLQGIAAVLRCPAPALLPGQPLFLEE